MEVILLERVRKLGQMGDVVKVKDGYARNFLLPQKKALRATDANRARFEKDKAQLEARNLQAKGEAEKVLTHLDGKTFVLLRQAGEGGQLYGSVTTRDIADIITTEGVSVARNQVNLDKPIKEIGLHRLEIVLHADVVSNVTINVARTKDEAERQARGENVLLERTEAEEAAIQAEALFERAEDAEKIKAGEKKPEGEAPEEE
jgi:large subunit ribosomal protein L9